MEYVLKTDNISKVYGKHKVVNGVNMHVKKGAIYGFIGKNGAGKTTFMRMIAGLAKPTEGTILLFESEDLEKQRKRLGNLIENVGAYSNLTARDNMEILRKSYGIVEKGRVDELLAFVGLGETRKKKVKNFSMGMKQRLGIAMSLLRNPDFLILDEPINGLDPEGIIEIRELLLRLNKEKGITILISSHILGELSKIATQYGVIRDGILIEEFEADELVDRCKRCQKLVVDSQEIATNVLENQLHINDYDVLGDGVIRIFNHLEMAEKINRELILNGVNIRESYLTGQDLEGYFMELLGGGADV